VLKGAGFDWVGEIWREALAWEERESRGSTSVPLSLFLSPNHARELTYRIRKPRPSHQPHAFSCCAPVQPVPRRGCLARILGCHTREDEPREGSSLTGTHRMIVGSTNRHDMASRQVRKVAPEAARTSLLQLAGFSREVGA
jgi:hypothetical protein